MILFTIILIASGGLLGNGARISRKQGLDSLLADQTKLDCQNFNVNPIECFAYNIFLSNSEIFEDMGDMDYLPRPILSKHYENKTVKLSNNVTFTCETQIESMPIFLFHKLNNNILQVYANKSAQFSIQELLKKYSESLQLRSNDMVDDYETKNPRIKLNRRAHSKDSNQDMMSDLETITMTITDTVESDKGYYLCIVANSVKSFRVTYGFLNVTNEILVVEKSSFFNWLQIGDRKVEIALLVAIFLLSVFLMLLCYHCCTVCIKSRLKIKKPSPPPYGDNIKKNNLLEKTIGSMKNNFVYVSMPDNVSTKSSEPSIHNSSLSRNLIDSSYSMEKSSHLFAQKMAVGYLEEDSNCWEFPKEKLKMGRLIDEGAFGRVYCADAFGIIPGRYKTVVAVKMIKENATKDEFINFIRELEVMKSLCKHENIISLLGCCTQQGQPYAIVEYAKFGNLRNYLRTHRPKDYILYSENPIGNSLLNECDQNDDISSLELYSTIRKKNLQHKQFATNQLSSFVASSPSTPLAANKSLTEVNLMTDLLKFCVNISSGMKFLHSKKICHRDLAARNILVDEFKVAKIADFGFARDLTQSYYYKHTSESPMPVKWMAPECLFDRKVYQNSDIWSFGITLYEIFTLGGNPYPSVLIEDLFDYLKDGNRMSKPIYADEEIYALILDCWNFKADHRPSFNEITSRLERILSKFEQKRNKELQSLMFNTESISSLKRGFTLISTPERKSSLLKDHKPRFNLTHQSESEDSQYFSGNDSSIVYADSSTFSTATPCSIYSNYSILPQVNAAAVKAASMMSASLAQRPPSPPAIKHFSKLLNVASAAYEL